MTNLPPKGKNSFLSSIEHQRNLAVYYKRCIKFDNTDLFGSFIAKSSRLVLYYS